MNIFIQEIIKFFHTPKVLAQKDINLELAPSGITKIQIEIDINRCWELYHQYFYNQFEPSPFNCSLFLFSIDTLKNLSWLSDLSKSLNLSPLNQMEKILKYTLSEDSSLKTLNGKIYFTDFLDLCFHLRAQNIEENIKKISSRIFLIKRLESLKDQVKYHNYNYYIKSQSSISNLAYDLLYDRYKKLSQLLNIPYDIAISEISESSPLIKIRHEKPLKTLSNTYSIEDIFSFHQEVLRRLKKINVIEDSISYNIQPKIDGASIILKYEKGKFKQALTRGDFEYGEDVTFNIKHLEDVPLKLEEEIDLTIRGEIYCSKDRFDEINQKLIQENRKPFANPRNLVSGSLRLLDSAEFSSRKFNLCVYDYLNSSIPFEQDNDFLRYLHKCGFKTFFPTNEVQNIQTINDEKFLIQYYEDYKYSSHFNIPLDGLVIKINSFYLREHLGTTFQKVNWAIAYKFSTERAVTKILDVEYSIGRYGTITPVGILSPVYMGGTIVKRVSLHNFDWVRERDIHYGDEVLIEKAGEIIPYLVGVSKEKRDQNHSKKIDFLEKCPSCHMDLIIEGVFQLVCTACGIKGKGRLEQSFKAKFFSQLSPINCGLCEKLLRKDIISSNIFCPNRIKCEKQIVEAISHFVSRDALNIDSIGKSTIDLLVKNGVLQNYSDLYYLNFKILEKLEGLGKKSLETLKKNIEESKKQPLSRLIYALGIPGIGKVVAKVLADYFRSLDTLINAQIEDLKKIHLIDEVLASNIYQFFRLEDIIYILKRLKEANLNFNESQEKSKEIEDNFFKDKSFLITGTFEEYKREELEKKISDLGGIIKKSVSKNIDYCFVGDRPGSSKMEKIHNLALKILTHEDLKKLNL